MDKVVQKVYNTNDIAQQLIKVVQNPKITKQPKALYKYIRIPIIDYTIKEDKLYFRDPETFAVKNIVSVTDNNGPLDSINEMELVDGVIYANVWQKDIIVKINPETGKVIGRADFSGMKEKYFPELAANTDVLNGIAYDSTAKRFFITGKNWPKLFEVKF